MYNGKAIYNPSGKAGEYSYWACNFYVGCSNGCTYCYLKKGRGAAILGGDKPTLKKCFKDDAHALEVFEKELKSNLPELQKHGLFFSFTTDPMLPETCKLTTWACNECLRNHVPIKILTKCSEWSTGVNYFVEHITRGAFGQDNFKMVAFGFTLTGHDELEPGASTNAERIAAMKRIHEAGFKTFASIEPIINFNDSLEMIKQANGYCDLFKIGLESGKNHPSQTLRDFIEDVTSWVGDTATIFFKDSLLKAAVINRESLPLNCVNRDYNLFNQEP